MKVGAAAAVMRHVSYIAVLAASAAVIGEWIEANSSTYETRFVSSGSSDIMPVVQTSKGFLVSRYMVSTWAVWYNEIHMPV